MDKLVAYAKSLDQASDSQEKLAQQLAAKAGVSVASARSAVGAMAPSGSAAAATAAQSIEVQTANKMLDAITAAITARTTDINNAGSGFMTKLIEGMANNKQTFVDLFVQMIKDAAAIINANKPPTNSNTSGAGEQSNSGTRNGGEVMNYAGIGLVTGAHNTSRFTDLGTNSFSQWQGGFISAARGSTLFRDTVRTLVHAELNTYVPD